MSSDMNVFKNNGFVIPSDKRKVVIDETIIKRTLKHLTAPVFDFFTKEETPEENPFINYEEEIQKYEMKSAIIQRILNDSDPTSRTRMNIVI